jgi:hypothetical protein
MLRRKFFIGLAATSLLFSVSFGQDDQARGWFVSRDHKAKPAPVKQRPRARRPASTASLPPATLGLGYTLFLANASGQLERVNPDRPFRSGEKIKLLVETNRDGYVYIFSQENNGAPRLLFPNKEVSTDSNFVPAHQPFWVPEKGEIEFDEKPAQERLFVVFNENELRQLAASNRPEGDPVEAKLFQELAQQTAARQHSQLEIGKLLTSREGTRGVRLNSRDPAPAFILLNQQPEQKRIVLNLQLTHR